MILLTKMSIESNVISFRILIWFEAIRSKSIGDMIVSHVLNLKNFALLEIIIGIKYGGEKLIDKFNM